MLGLIWVDRENRSLSEIPVESRYQESRTLVPPSWIELIAPLVFLAQF